MAFNQGHALLIGVASHAHAPAADMPIMLADAEAIASALRDEGLCGYPRDQVHVLTGNGATREGILMALGELAERTRSGDTALVFYSGHSASSRDGAYHLVTHDARIEEGYVVEGTGVSAADLLALFNTVPAGRMLIMLNTPLTLPLPNPPPPSPDALGPLPIQRNPPEAFVAALLATGGNRVVITACREGQIAHVGNGLLTIFTQAFFDALRGAGTGNASAISAFRLYDYIHATVGAVVREAFNTAQEPELAMHTACEPFVIGHYRGVATAADVIAADPPPQGAVRIVDPQHSERLLSQTPSTGGILERVKELLSRATRPHQDGNVAVDVASGTDTQAFHHMGEPAHQSLVELIKEIRRAIQTSNLDDAKKAAALEDLDHVDEQLVEAAPDLSTIRRRLNAALSVVTGSTQAAETTEVVQTLTHQALALAQQQYR